ncbi:LRR domain containing protein [Parasponia andersonii]|uniref:LRR domain containing protein n=1 Tax=Parasponia andersonii TaxID=3476 RepID=A0A2P5E5F4_PARAD|nr:LRR domain containing protein [Parasponia andersonii]
MPALCHVYESFALLQFKESLTINNSASRDPLAYPKVSSWTVESDWCSWDGVECDENSGHVIALNLSGSCLCGSINSSNSLVRFTQLERLNPADNHFNYSRILPELGHFPKLTHLNLSASFFTSKTRVLGPLHNRNLSGHFPEFRSRSPLRTLWFSDTSLSGKIPNSIWQLESLEFFSVARWNRLTGQIPHWIGNLTSLTVAIFARNKLYGPVPQSLSRLKHLRSLNLFENDLNGTVDFNMFLEMKHLAELGLDGNMLSVIFRKENATVVRNKFEILGLNSCNLKHFPDFLSYKNGIRYLDLGGNNIHGLIPKWIWNSSAETMAYLALNDNFLTGIKQYSQGDNKESEEILSDIFCNLKSLQLLDFSNNLLSGSRLPKCLEHPNNLLSVLNIRSNLFAVQFLNYAKTTEEAR